jgi:hypothetical protein
MKKCKCRNILFYTDYLPGGKFRHEVSGMTDTRITFENIEYRCTGCGKWHKFDLNNPVIK